MRYIAQSCSTSRNDPGRHFARAYFTRARDLVKSTALGNFRGQALHVISLQLRCDLSHQVVQKEIDLATILAVGW